MHLSLPIITLWFPHNYQLEIAITNTPFSLDDSSKNLFGSTLDKSPSYTTVYKVGKEFNTFSALLGA